jgi:hypothetical protein
MRKLVMKCVILLACLEISRVEDMMQMMRQRLETTAIGDARWRDRTAMFGRRANTWLIIAKTDCQNSLPIIPDNSRFRNYQELSGKIGIPIIPKFSQLANHPR